MLNEYEYILVVSGQNNKVVANMETNKALRFSTKEKAEAFLWNMDATLVMNLSVLEILRGHDLMLLPSTKQGFGVANTDGDYPWHEKDDNETDESFGF